MNRQKKVLICINGIRVDPGAADGWTDRAVTWLNCRFSDDPNLLVVGEKFEYACNALTRRIHQASRAQAIAKMIGFYSRSGFEVTLVGHSNGCDIIARVLDQVEGVHSVHLFAAAADAIDFENAIREEKVQIVHLYGSPNDSALKIAGVSRTLFGWLGLGYGSLGRNGAQLAGRFPTQVFNHEDPTQGHSTWFTRGEQFESTMRQISKNEFHQ